jgi:hypothetical protein
MKATERLGQITTIKGKAKVLFVVEGLSEQFYNARELAESARQGTLAQQRVAMEALEHFSRRRAFQMHDEILEFIVLGLDSKDATLKREAARLTANCAHFASERLDHLLPLVLKNLEDNGTVVRWGAALAFEAIVRNRAFQGGDLRALVEELMQREEKQSIRKILFRSILYIR